MYIFLINTGKSHLQLIKFILVAFLLTINFKVYSQGTMTGYRTTTKYDIRVINDDRTKDDAAIRLQSRSGNDYNDWTIVNWKLDGSLYISNWQISSGSYVGGNSNTYEKTLGHDRLRIARNGDMRVYGNALIDKRLKINGADLELDYTGRRINTNGRRRALVHADWDELNINFDNDYPGGVRIGTRFHFKNDGSFYAKGPFQLYGDVTANSAGNATIQAKDNSTKSNIGLQFQTQLKGTPITALQISPKGYIGVGTANPRDELEVVGTIRVDTLKVRRVSIDPDGHPDFVFEDTYNLMPLKVLNNYIKTNKHLPGMQSEKEVIKDGLELISFSQKLLEKIEELTLYLIEQEQEIKVLKQMMKASSND